MARSAEPCKLTASIVVEMPVQQCWSLYINQTELPIWAPAIAQVECNNALIDIDVIRKCTVIANGKCGHTVECCTHFDPLKRIDFNVVEETFGFSHMLTHYGLSTTFDVEGENTLLVMCTHYVPKRIFASVMTSSSTQQQLLQMMNEALQGFKHYAEQT